MGNQVFIFILFIVLLVGDADTAFALQTHGAPEGIYVHQMAHVLFLAALMYLSWHTRKTQETSGRGWLYFQVFCIFMILWNILAFTGHEAYEHLTAVDFINPDRWDAKLAAPVSFTKGLYYVTKMDHFLIVPAMMALVASLRSFYLNELGKRRK